MNITRNNFRDKFDELKEVINAANFIAIDCEFTGLSQDNARVQQYDSPSDYFHKISQQTSGYIAIQFGFTAFRAKEVDSQNFTYRSYNFYVFPQARKQRFECQGDSMAFLGSNNFDFNMLFREGLSYCDEDEAKRLQQQFGEKVKLIESAEENKKNGDEPVVAVPFEEQEHLDRLNDQIEEFLKSADDEKCVGKNCNAFQRKLIYQLLEQRYSETISASSRSENNQKVVVLTKIKSEEQLKEIQMAEIEKERILMEDAIGFHNFISFLSQTKKLIVGHNMLLDVIYIMKQFIGPISQKIQDFKTKTHKTFPNLIDTKYMCTDDTLKPHIYSSVLARLLDTTSTDPFTRPTFAETEEYSYSLDKPKEHEAGYDSFITGICFITMANFLQIDSCDISPKAPRLRQILNKFFLPIDVNHINLTGKEPPPPSREHVFHLTMPKAWTNNNIYQIFRLYGNVRISWLNDTTCFVALHNRENATGLLKSIGKHEGVTIISFADYKSRQDKSTPPDPIKRKLEPEDKHECISQSNKKTKQQGTSQHFQQVDDW